VMPWRSFIGLNHQLIDELKIAWRPHYCSAPSV
jgi:hypothetical protein